MDLGGSGGTPGDVPAGTSGGPSTSGAGGGGGALPIATGGVPASQGGSLNGGGSSSGAASGSAGAAPTPLHYIRRVGFGAPPPVDVLFVVDNSPRMGVKQALLAEAVPKFIERLANPACFDASGAFTGELSTNGVCAEGVPEFAPIRELHLGVVTSSIGDMGSADACMPGTRELDDRGRLLPSVRDSLPSWNGQGFLSWDPDERAEPPGSADIDELASAFSDHVLATGEGGCRYEASLEAWYRFLVDPDPPDRVFKDADDLTHRSGSDATLLAQRKAFLRPDSVVAIVMLTDENDCSIIDYGQGWVTGLSLGGFVFPRSTSVCADDPNDPCCFSCSLSAASVPSGCTLPAADAECSKGAYTASEDHLELRCYEQKRRFGADFLQPTSRYVEGLTREVVNGVRSGFQSAPVVKPELNALFAQRRLPSMVFLAGIVGVPWQDVSDEADWHSDRSLRFLSHDELVEQGRWSWLLGTPAPEDGLMYETPLDRSALAPTVPQRHPSDLGALAPSTSSEQNANPINGHESNLADGSALQAACTFPLREPRDCSSGDAGCECTESDQQYERAVCDGLTQTHASASPGIRQLEVLKAFGDLTGNAVVASICPKLNEVSTAGDRNAGYVPALDSLVARMQSALLDQCITRDLPMESDGSTSCFVIETLPPDFVCTPCSERPGRAEPRVDVASTFENVFVSSCTCEIQQFEADALRTCRTDLAPFDQPGFCVVNDEPAAGEPNDDAAREARRALLAECPPQAPRILRFGPNILRPESRLYLACLRPTSTDP